jgi:hypothetical protein
MKTATVATHRQFWGHVSRFLLIAALVVLVGHVLIYVHYAIGLMRFPFDYDQGEGFELVDTMLFSEGEWPYRNTEVYPFYASNYPPLFHVMLVPFEWAFGPAYWYGRLAGFLSTVITAIVIGYIVQREAQHRLVAVLSGLAFLASNYVYHVGPLFRQHMTMVMFETLGVLMLAHVTTIADDRRRRRIMLLGLVLLLAAGYTKQLAIGTCVAVFVFLFLRSPRRSIAWGVIFALAAGAIFLWINLATGGEWWKNIIAANVNTYLPHQFVNLFQQWLRLHGVLVFMAGLYAAYELYFTRLSLYTIWWVAALGITLLSGKWGAGDSYFATAIAASCVLAGMFAARTLRGDWQLSPEHPYVRRLGQLREWGTTHRGIALAVAGVVIPALYLVYGLTVIKMPTEGRVFGALSDTLGLESSYGERYAFYDAAGWVEGYATIGHVPTQRDIDNGWAIVDIIEAHDRPTMSEEAGFSIQAGKDVITNPTQLKNLYENELFDESALVAAIEAHDFGVVIFRAQFYPPPVVDAVYRAYYPAQAIPMNGFNYEVWRPGPPQAERDAVAAALDDLRPGQQSTLTLSLPEDAVSSWLAHYLTYRGGGAARPGPLAQAQHTLIAALRGCRFHAYHQGAARLYIQACPDGELTLTRQ